MSDIGIRKTIYFIVGGDTLVVFVVLIDIVRGQYEQLLTSLADILNIVIGKMVLPSTDLRKSE
jgi:hypothetical protein